MKHTVPANENTYNMKHLLQYMYEIGETFLEHTVTTYMYSHYNICAIIYIKQLQHTFETDETFKTYTCNICV
jgi:hypothetical protein